MPRFWTLVSALVITQPVIGCSGAAESDPADRERAEDRHAAILDGVPATGFPEAVLVNSDFGRCSGVLVRPDIVLTAGHCITTGKTWIAIAPNAGPSAVSAAALGGKVFDKTNDSNLAGQQHDVGLVVLNSPIDIPAFAVLPTAPLPFDTEVVGVGRKHDTTDTSGQIASESDPGDELFVSKPAKLLDSTKTGFPSDYKAFPGYATEGDSGGPAFLTNAAGPHVVVGVASKKWFASEGFVTLLARVDLQTVPELKDYVASVDLTNAAPEAAAIIDPCGGETFAGHCEGDVLRWCEGGTTNTFDCATTAMTCGFDSTLAFFGCR